MLHAGTLAPLAVAVVRRAEYGARGHPMTPLLPAPWRTLLVASSLLLLGTGCAATTTERLGLPELPTVASVDLERYQGLWYEIASFPQWFQEGCTGTTATYRLNDEGEVDVLNRCFLETLDGELSETEGTARVTDPKTRSKLEVTFFWPFYGAYWIIDLDPSYAYAVVGHPSRDYLWILSRTPTLDEDVYAGILERLEAMGYPLDRLHETLQRTPSAGSRRGPDTR